MNNKLLTETIVVTLNSDWTAVSKANYILLSAKSLRDDSTFRVVGISKHSNGAYVIFFSDGNTGANLQIEATWLKVND